MRTTEVPDWFVYPDWYDQEVAEGNPLYTSIVDAALYLAEQAQLFGVFEHSERAVIYKAAALGLLASATQLYLEAKKANVCQTEET